MNLKTLKSMQIFRKAANLQTQFPHRGKTRIKKPGNPGRPTKRKLYTIKGRKLSF
jgi:hypothetical protein